MSGLAHARRSLERRRLRVDPGVRGPDRPWPRGNAGSGKFGTPCLLVVMNAGVCGHQSRNTPLARGEADLRCRGAGDLRRPEADHGSHDLRQPLSGVPRKLAPAAGAELTRRLMRQPSRDSIPGLATWKGQLGQRSADRVEALVGARLSGSRSGARPPRAMGCSAGRT